VARSRVLCQPPPDAIGAGVTAGTGADVQRLAAVVAARSFDGGTDVIALRHPAVETGFKSGVANQVDSVGRAEHFHVVEQTLAFAEENHLHAVHRSAIVALARSTTSVASMVVQGALPGA